MSTLNTQQTRNSSEFLICFEYLFHGSLGMCNNPPVDLELMDDAKPVCSQPYPVPRLHEFMFIK